jgi:hypothetical protein
VCPVADIDRIVTPATTLLTSFPSGGHVVFRRMTETGAAAKGRHEGWRPDGN